MGGEPSWVEERFRAIAETLVSQNTAIAQTADGVRQLGQGQQRLELLVTTVVAESKSQADRMTRMEGGPQRLQPWISSLVTAGIGCLSLVISFASLAFVVVTWLLLHGR